MPVHQLPEMLDTQRILANDVVLEFSNRHRHGPGPSLERAFAGADDPFIGVDADEDEIPPAVMRSDWFDIDDLHGVRLPLLNLAFDASGGQTGDELSTEKEIRNDNGDDRDRDTGED